MTRTIECHMNEHKRCRNYSEVWLLYIAILSLMDRCNHVEQAQLTARATLVIMLMIDITVVVKKLSVLVNPFVQFCKGFY